MALTCFFSFVFFLFFSPEGNLQDPGLGVYAVLSWGPPAEEAGSKGLTLLPGAVSENFGNDFR